ncbi:MAG: guanylate kinase [Oscillospiraceae bacterium]|jgi:guanylate kinase|nr:guanylate kinase [Oscillospiraceae bacterium]
MRKGLLMVISGPAGAGKGTLADMLMRRDGGFTFSVSATTRAPRRIETPGVHYHFLTEAEFDEMEAAGDFLETATVHGHRYGTPLKPVMQMLNEGRDLLLDIDAQGAKSVLSKLAECVSVFILPPSFAELERRLRARDTESEEEMRRRMHNAHGEVAQMDRYRYVIINDQLEKAYEQLEAIVAAERLSTVRYRPEII